MKTESKKLTLLFLTFITVLFFNQACQFKPTEPTTRDVSIQDVVRIHHAKSLLSKQYQKSVVAEFERDRLLHAYLQRYIAQENVNLNPDDLKKNLMQVSREHFYDPVFILAVIKTESQFNPTAIGSHGEIGLMQIKPDTAEWLCQKYKIPWLGAEALKNPSYNIKVGALYFKYLKKSLKKQPLKSSINAYNLGLASWRRLPADSQTRHPYYEKVMANYLTIYEELKKIRQTI